MTLGRHYGFIPMALIALPFDSDRAMTPTKCPPLFGRDATIRRSIASANNLVRRAQRRVEAARQQVLRADAVVRRVRVYLEQYDDAREPCDVTDDQALAAALDDRSR